MYWTDSGALAQSICQRVPHHVQPRKCPAEEWVLHPHWFVHFQCIAAHGCLVKHIYVLDCLVLTELTIMK